MAAKPPGPAKSGWYKGDPIDGRFAHGSGKSREFAGSSVTSLPLSRGPLVLSGWSWGLCLEIKVGRWREKVYSQQWRVQGEEAWGQALGSWRGQKFPGIGKNPRASLDFLLLMTEAGVGPFSELKKPRDERPGA